MTDVFVPSTYQKKWARQEHQVVEEENLDVVARTRAMVRTVYLIEEAAR